MFVFLDIETTGFDGKKDDLLEVSAIRWNGKEEVARFDTLVSLPFGKNIPAMITSLTGITEQMCEEEGKDLASVISEFQTFLLPDDVIVGHNISFDIGFLNAKGTDIKNTSIDTFLLSVLVLGRTELSHSLEVLAQKYGILQENAHRAMSDVEANLQFYIFLQTLWHNNTDEAFAQFLKENNTKLEFPEYQFFAETPIIPFVPAFSSESLSSFSLELSSSAVHSYDDFLHTSGKVCFAEVSSSENELRSIIASSSSPIVIAYPNDETELSLELYESIKECFPTKTIRFYGNPHQQIDEKLFDQFLQKSSYTREETIVLLKILRARQNDDMHYLRFMGEEWKAVRSLFSPHEEIPEPEEEIAFLPFSQVYHTPHSSKLIVLRGENLETMLEEKEKIKVFEKRLREDIPDFPFTKFEKLSGILRSIKGENQWAVPVYDMELKHIAGVRECLEEIENEVRMRDTWAVAPWQRFFEEKESESYIFCIELFSDNALAFSLIPKTLQESFDELSVCGDGVLVLGRSFPRTLQNQLQFTFSVAPGVQYLPYSQSVPPLSLSYSLDMIRSFLLEGKNVVVSVTSKKAGDDIIEALRSFCEEHTVFIAGGKGGSPKKQRLQMLQSPLCLVVGNSSFLDSLRVEYLQNVEVVIPKLSFDPPNHPVLSARRKNANIRNDFEDFALPRATQRLWKEIYRIPHAEMVVLGDEKFAQPWAKKMIERK